MYFIFKIYIYIIKYSIYLFNILCPIDPSSKFLNNPSSFTNPNFYINKFKTIYIKKKKILLLNFTNLCIISNNKWLGASLLKTSGLVNVGINLYPKL